MHVVLAAELAPPLEEADEANDLAAALNGEVEPLLLRRRTGRERAEELRKGKAVGLRDVSAESHHGDAAVLDLSLAQEAIGRLVALAPEVRIRKAEGIEVADGGVQRRSELLLRRHRDGSVAHGADGRRRGRRAEHRCTSAK